MQRAGRRAKIICTIGPASAGRRTIAALLRGGMDVARLNFSHGDRAWHEKTASLIREEAARLGRQVALIQDLQGIKIRTGTARGGSVRLRKGETVLIRPGSGESTQSVIHVSYPRIARDAKKGDAILIDDGLIELKVTGNEGGALSARVVGAGTLGDRKGVNLPGMRISTPSFTPKDREDLAFGLGMEVDYVAVSFVREAGDIRKVRRFLRARGKDLPLIAKIEKPEAVERIDEILAEADGIMVARGDLGVELPAEEVPLVQKDLIARANARGRLVITATQMLESMTGRPRPTRAEAADVANAVIDGTDALMLSAETSVGMYPAESVETMKRIIETTEEGTEAVASYLSGNTYSEAVASSAAEAAEATGARSIVAFTRSGYTALLLSKCRPRAPILAFTPEERVMRRLSLYWGVTPMAMRPLESTDEMVREVERTLLGRGLVRRGQTVVITASSPVGGEGKTNLMKLHRVGERAGP